jgi:hypothetical protein
VSSAGDQFPGYTYALSAVPVSPITLTELAELKISAGFTDEDRDLLNLAGEVLTSQTQQIVARWRSGIIANIPHLARHSRSPDNQPLPDYLARSNRRFERWIMAAGGHAQETVEKMHEAWCKSLQLQIALWSRIYSDPKLPSPQW